MAAANYLERVILREDTGALSWLIRALLWPWSLIYRAGLAERLPVIPIPLRETDSDVTLDLQALIDQCYRNGRYDDLDYKAEPNPPLDPPDAAWADELLRSKGNR